MCVAGEVYCWWQNYNPSTDPSAGPSFLPSTTIESNYTPSLEGSTDAVDSFEASGDPAEEASLEQQQGYGEINATYSSTTSQPAPTTCLVMGNGSTRSSPPPPPCFSLFLSLRDSSPRDIDSYARLESRGRRRRGKKGGGSAISLASRGRISPIRKYRGNIGRMYRWSTPLCATIGRNSGVPTVRGDCLDVLHLTGS